MLRRQHAEWIVGAAFLLIIAVVFWQIRTDMTESGIASGGPNDNAAAYPRAVVLIIAALLAVQCTSRLVKRGSGEERREESESRAVAFAELRRPLALLGAFAVYLWTLGVLGYHVSTPLLLAAVMLLGGIRKPATILIGAPLISVGLAFVFEFFLNIVLPGGLFGLNIPW